ncbi:hypothetical protein GQ472_01500 [archaeon]|nr:hypothetical protein [archaeon]
MVNIAYDTFFKAFARQLSAFLIVLVLLAPSASALTTTATITIEDPNSAVIVNNAPMACGAVVCVGNFGEADCTYAYDFTTCTVWGDYDVTITYTHAGTNCDGSALDPVTSVETFNYFIYHCADTKAPTTTDNYGIKDGIWQGSDQTITLTASDPAVSSGIKDTKYCIDATDTCIPSINYVSPVTITTEGTSYFRYRSTDNANNVQAIVSRKVMIDKSGFSVDAGTDKTTNSIFTQDATVTIPISGISSYSWSKVSGPGNIIFGSSASEDTTIRTNTDGTYVIRLTVIDNLGNSVSDTMTLVWDTTDPTTFDNYAAKDGNWQGSDQTIVLTPTDPAPSSGISSTKYCIDATDTCIPSIDYAGSFIITTEGTSYFRYRSVDNVGNVQAIVSRKVMIDKSGFSVNAGTDKTTDSIFTQDATVTIPISGISSYSWSKVSGPGNIIFGSSAAEDTTIRASADGTYTIRLTVIDNVGNSVSDTMTLVWDTTDPTTSDNYGAKDGIWQNSDQTIILTPTDPAPSSGLSYTRYCIDTTNTCVPSVNYAGSFIISAQGTSYFRYRSADNVGNVQNIVSRTVMIDKTPLTVDAGTDKTTNSIFTQDGTVSVPLSGISSYSWTKRSGPGNIIFGSSGAEDTTIRADADGTYVIRLTAISNSGNSGFDEMILIWDTKDPTTSDNYGAKDSIWQTSDQTIILTPSDPAPSSGLVYTQYCIDATDACTPSTDYAGPVLMSSEGINFFRYRSADNAGNIQTIVSREVMIDKSPPSITIESPEDKTYDTQWIWFNVTAIDTYVSVDWCGFSLNGSANVTMGNDSPTHFYYINKSVYVGDYNVVFHCNDSNGLMNSTSISFKVEYDCMLNEDLDPECVNVWLCRLNKWIKDSDNSTDACCCMSSGYWETAESCCDSADSWLSGDSRWVCSTGVVMGVYTGPACSPAMNPFIVDVETVFECNEIEIGGTKMWWDGSAWVTVAPLHCVCTQDSDCNTAGGETCIENMCVTVIEPGLALLPGSISIPIGETGDIILEIKNDMTVTDSIKINIDDTMEISNWAWFNGQKNKNPHSIDVIISPRSTKMLLIEILGGKTGTYTLRVSAESLLTLKYVSDTATVRITPKIDSTTGVTSTDTPGLSGFGFVIVLLFASLFIYSGKKRL